MFKFTIRELLLLTLVAGLGLGWWMNRRQLIAQRDTWQRRAESIAANVTAEGYTVRWDDDSIWLITPDGALSYVRTDERYSEAVD